MSTRTISSPATGWFNTNASSPCIVEINKGEARFALALTENELDGVVGYKLKSTAEFEEQLRLKFESSVGFVFVKASTDIQVSITNFDTPITVDPNEYLLLQDGSFLLLQDGSKLIIHYGAGGLESPPNGFTYVMSDSDFVLDGSEYVIVEE